ncbi:MAG TPA: sensor histidine kinase [Bryobacteraceae bacterium]|nr:sensor histidine kinase [Bryobacteraceae bacterium]
METLFSRLKPQSERAVGIISANWAAVSDRWRRQIGELGLSPQEFDFLSNAIREAGSRRSDGLTFEEFQSYFTQLGEQLAEKHVDLSSALTSLHLLIEITEPYLDLGNGAPAPDNMASATRRLYGIAVLAIITGYTRAWKAEQQSLAATLERAGRRRHQASAYVTNVYEQERRRLSHDLHDDIGHQLLLLKLYLELMVTDAKQGEIPQMARRLDEALVLVSSAIESVRRLILDLGPAIFDDLGFLAAIRFYARQFSSRTAITVTVRAPELPENIPMSHQIALYRVLQGALSNVVEHARAGRVKVTIEAVDQKRLIMVVEDNGVGFNTASMSGRSFGLTAMRERVEILGGSLLIDSTTAASQSPRTGTRISVELPLPEASNE